MATPSLAMIPCGRKATKLYSVLPTDGTGDFTVSRASQGSEINSDLKIQNVANNVPRFTYDTLNGCPSLLTEPQSTNLITYPVSFGNSYWTKSGATIEGDASTAGAEEVANGDVESALPTVNSQAFTSSVSTTIIQSGDRAQSGTYSMKGTATTTINNLYVIPNDATLNNKFIKVTGYVYIPASNTTQLNADVKARINGTFVTLFSTTTTNTWVYFEVYYNHGSTPSTDRDILVGADACAIGDVFYVDNITLQEVQGFSSPHVDYPTSAFKLVEDTSTGVHGISKGVSAVGSDYSLSILAKADSRRYVSLAFSDAVVWLAQYTFDLVGGTLTDSYDFAGVTSTFKSEALADGWYRLSLSSNYAFAATVYARIFIEETATPPTIPSNTYTGDGTSGVYLFGAQAEQQSVATSFMYNGIENVTTQRFADVVTDAGDSSTFNSLEGVFYLEASSKELSLQRNIEITDGTANNKVLFYYSSDNTSIYFAVIIGGVLTCNIVATVDITETHKFAGVWSNNLFQFWVDGVHLAGDVLTGGTFPANTLNTLSLNSVSGGSELSANVYEIQTYNATKTDAEMITLTTL